MGFAGSNEVGAAEYVVEAWGADGLSADEVAAVGVGTLADTDAVGVLLVAGAEVGLLDEEPHPTSTAIDTITATSLPTVFIGFIGKF